MVTTSKVTLRRISYHLLLFPVVLLLSTQLWAQSGTEGSSNPEESTSTSSSEAGEDASSSNDPEKDRPNQFNLFKINVSQFAINEARVLYERQIGPASSLEFGVGYIYPNAFWIDRSTEEVLATGFGIYAAYRKYRILQRYFSTPKFRPYFSPTLFYRYSAYTNEWFLFPGGLPEDSECGRFSRTFHQIATTIRFGWQSSVGRIAVDFYAGIGVKFIPSTLEQNAFNRGTDVCEELPDTDYSVFTEDIFDTNIILQGGIKLGIRQNNRKQNFTPREGSKNELQPDPPTYRP